MGQMEQIQEQLRGLPPDKQREVLDFVSFLRQQESAAQGPLKPHSLRQHPAFGSWQGRNVDGLDYQHALRSEWDTRTRWPFLTRIL